MHVFNDRYRWRALRAARRQRKVHRNVGLRQNRKPSLRKSDAVYVNSPSVVIPLAATMLHLETIHS